MHCPIILIIYQDRQTNVKITDIWQLDLFNFFTVPMFHLDQKCLKVFNSLELKSAARRQTVDLYSKINNKGIQPSICMNIIISSLHILLSVEERIRCPLFNNSVSNLECLVKICPHEPP